MGLSDRHENGTKRLSTCSEASRRIDKSLEEIRQVEILLRKNGLHVQAASLGEAAKRMRSVYASLEQSQVEELNRVVK